MVDDHSTDETVRLCEALGARTFSRTLEGFAAQKQYALDQTTGEWALSIDADERVTPKLAELIRHTITSAGALNGYRLRREMYFLGHRLRFGGVGTDWPVRLIRKNGGRYVPTQVHERIEVSGLVGDLDAPLAHYSYATLSEYLEKSNHYTTLAAQDLWARGRRYSPLDYLRPLWELFARIVLKSAWLDGAPGLMYAAFSSHAAWVRSMKLWEIERRG